MVWTIDFTKSAAKQFDQLDKAIQIRIVKFINTRLVKMDDPRQLGKSLQGTLSDYWAYRVGDYRLLAVIEEHRLVIVLTDIAHRRHVYKM